MLRNAAAAVTAQRRTADLTMRRGWEPIAGMECRMEQLRDESPMPAPANTRVRAVVRFLGSDRSVPMSAEVWPAGGCVASVRGTAPGPYYGRAP